MRRTRQPDTHAELDELIGLAVNYARDFVAPNLKRRPPSAMEAEALRDLDAELAKLPPDASAEDIQTAVFEVGKRHPFESLRALVPGALRNPARLQPGPAHGQLHRALRDRQQPQADRGGAGGGPRLGKEGAPAGRNGDFAHGFVARDDDLLARRPLFRTAADPIAGAGPRRRSAERTPGRPSTAPSSIKGFANAFASHAPRRRILPPRSRRISCNFDGPRCQISANGGHRVYLSDARAAAPLMPAPASLSASSSALSPATSTSGLTPVPSQLSPVSGSNVRPTGMNAA